MFLTKEKKYFFYKWTQKWFLDKSSQDSTSLLFQHSSGRGTVKRCWKEEKSAGKQGERERKKTATTVCAKTHAHTLWKVSGIFTLKRCYIRYGFSDVALWLLFLFFVFVYGTVSLSVRYWRKGEKSWLGPIKHLCLGVSKWSGHVHGPLPCAGGHWRH